MSETIPQSHMVLFEKPIVANLATLMPNGQPQVNPVWCDFDGTHLRVNSSVGRRKDKNMRANPRVTALLVDPENPFFWVEIRGQVAEITTEGSDAHIDQLAKKYLGKDSYPFRSEGEVRVIYKILPSRIVTSG